MCERFWTLRAAAQEPRDELVDARGRPQIDEPGQDVGKEICLRIDPGQLAGLDELNDVGSKPSELGYEPFPKQFVLRDLRSFSLPHPTYVIVRGPAPLSP